MSRSQAGSGGSERLGAKAAAVSPPRPGTTRPAPDQRAGERGQIGVLVLGLCVIVLTFVVGIVNVTAVQRSRVRLYDACDAAALGAADALSEAAAYRSGVRARLPVTQEGVRREVDRYLAGTPRPPGVRSWRVESGTGTGDGESATVVLTGVIDMPIAEGLLASAFGPITVTVTATAESRVDSSPAVTP